MFTKDQIDAWIKLATEGENGPGVEPSPSLRLRILEAKVLTDRWEQVVTDIIFHSSHKDAVHEILKDNLTKTTELGKALQLLAKLGEKLLAAERGEELPEIDTTLPEVTLLWGSRVHFVDEIPADKGLMLVLDTEKQLQDKEHPDRCVSVFPM